MSSDQHLELLPAGTTTALTQRDLLGSIIEYSIQTYVEDERRLCTSQVT